MCKWAEVSLYLHLERTDWVKVEGNSTYQNLKKEHIIFVENLLKSWKDSMDKKSQFISWNYSSELVMVVYSYRVPNENWVKLCDCYSHQ